MNKALTIYLKAIGEEHPYTIDTSNEVAAILKSMTDMK